MPLEPRTATSPTTSRTSGGEEVGEEELKNWKGLFKSLSDGWKSSNTAANEANHAEIVTLVLKIVIVVVLFGFSFSPPLSSEL